MAEVEIKQENLVYGKSPLLTDNVMHYCPGCSHGTVHKLVAEVIGGDGHGRPHDRRFARGLRRFRIQLYRHRLDRGGARPCAGHRVGRQAAASREHGLHLPGRRRPFGDRYGRDDPCRRTRRERGGGLHQQCHLRHDGRADGPHDAVGHENRDDALWPRPAAERLPLQDRRDDGAPRRYGLHHAPERPHAGQRPQMQASSAQGVRDGHGRQGFSLVEVVSTCNSGWKMSPVAANEWLAQNMLPYYPLGDIKSNE